MTSQRLVCLAICAAGACRSASRTDTPVAAVPASPVSPGSPATPRPGTPTGTSVHDDVTVQDGVVRVGEPRMQLADDASGMLLVRAKAGLVFADQGARVEVWELQTGKPVHDIALAGRGPVSLAVSYDASALAIGTVTHVQVARAPFDRVDVDLACSNARAFSHDGKLLACDHVQPEIWDLGKHTRLAAAKASDAVRVARFSPDDKSLFFATRHELARWDFATSGAIAPVYKTADNLATVVFSNAGSALVTQRPASAYTGGHTLLVELASGRTTALPDSYFGSLSPSGKLVAIVKPTELDVLEAADGKVVWKGAVTPPVSRVAFGEDDRVLAFGETGSIHVIELPAGTARRFDAPSRFAGWLGDGTAAIDRGGALAGLALATTSWVPADPHAIVPARPKGAPAWAQWLADAPGGVMAAEPSKRHDAGVRHRDLTECDRTLRVWTATGGTKAFALACTESGDAAPDPGWEIGGGWVVALTTKLATIYDAATGKRAAALPLDPPDHPKFPPEYWASSLSPDGSLLALVWRHPVVGGGPDDPREDAMHQADEHDRADCDRDALGQCIESYVIDVWSLGTSPHRLWQEPLPVAPSGALVFDHAGKHLLLGLVDGGIRVWDTSPAHPGRSLALHHFAIARLGVAPGDAWAFSEDAAGEQRLWRLTAP